MSIHTTHGGGSMSPQSQSRRLFSGRKPNIPVWLWLSPVSCWRGHPEIANRGNPWEEPGTAPTAFFLFG